MELVSGNTTIGYDKEIFSGILAILFPLCSIDFPDRKYGMYDNQIE